MDIGMNRKGQKQNKKEKKGGLQGEAIMYLTYVQQKQNNAYWCHKICTFSTQFKYIYIIRSWGNQMSLV